MTFYDIIKNPFTWIILSIIISIVLYFSISKSQPSTRKTCNSNEEIIKGECVSKCNDGQVRCGSTISCYDPIQEYCDSTTFQVCSITNESCKKCCPDGHTCSEGTCLECDSKFKCGKKCCDDKTPQCCNNDECCTKDAKCTKDGCCEAPNQVCGDYCCNVSAGLNCIDNKCQIGCPAIDPQTKKLPDGFTGTPLSCDPKTSVCFQNPTINDVNQQYKCLPKGCEWGDTFYTPEQSYLDTDGRPIHVCQDTNKSLWISKQNMNDLTSMINVGIKNYDPEKCTNDTCFQKIYQDGSTVIKGLNLKYSNGQIKDNNCTSELLCEDLLIPYNDQVTLKNVCANQNSILNNQCCIVNDLYSGQICPKGYKCNVDTCIQIGSYDPYCNNNGITRFDGNKIICECGNPKQIYDDHCYKIKSSNYFNKDFFRNYLSSLSKEDNGWPLMYIFIVSNHIKNWKIIPWVNDDVVTADSIAKDIFSAPVTQTAYKKKDDTIAFQIQDASSKTVIAWATYKNNGPYWQLQTDKQSDNPEPLSSLPINYKFYDSGELQNGYSPCFVIYASTYIDGTDDPIGNVTCGDYYNKGFFANYISSLPSLSSNYSIFTGWNVIHVFIVCNNIKKWKIIDWVGNREDSTSLRISVPPLVKGFYNEELTQAIYNYRHNYASTIAFQIKDADNNIIAWATYKNTSPYWELETGKQSDNPEPLSSLPINYKFYNSGDLFDGSAACLVIIASNNVDGSDN